MDHKARARFTVWGPGRWPLVLLFLAGITWLSLPEGAAPLAVFSEHRPVRPGVTLMGRPVGGLQEAQLRPLLEELARTYQLDPVGAQPVQRTITTVEDGRELTFAGISSPGDGYLIDVEATLLRLQSARSGQAVVPAVKRLSAPWRLEDFPGKAVYRGNPNRRQVALMINVAWEDPGALQSMLSTLSKTGSRATFFFTGYFAGKYPEYVQAAAKAGHEIASHGYFEARTALELQRAGKLREDLTKAKQVLEPLAGKPVRLFAPHKGEHNEQVVRLAAELGQRTIMWSRDTIDWQEPDPSTIVNRVVPRAQNGDLVLMHPKRVTAQALPQIIAGLRRQGFELVTVSEALATDPPEPGEQKPGLDPGHPDEGDPGGRDG